MLPACRARGVKARGVSLLRLRLRHRHRIRESRGSAPEGVPSSSSRSRELLLLLPLPVLLLRERGREARIVGASGAQLRLESLHGAVDVLQLRPQRCLLQ